MQVTAIEADGAKVTGVSLEQRDAHHPADLVVVGVGVLPNVELAAEAGLPVASGIIVDEHLLTADPNISAIGDCALYTSKRFGGSLRLKSVQNATDHARCVASRLTGKTSEVYDGLAVVLERPGGRQAADGGSHYRLRPRRGARRSRAGGVLGVLLSAVTGCSASSRSIAPAITCSAAGCSARGRFDHTGASGGCEASI